MTYKSYLLYTKAQETAFRSKYGRAVSDALQRYEDWFYSFPLYEWAPVSGITPKTAEFQIGMLCLLMWEGRANFCIDFPPDGGVILQRYARNKEEYDKYIQKHFVKPKIITR